ncbi:MAG TPA: rhodanese-like domain-containing protein [Hyphomicrobiaceae bacterium]|nr:rhodanese-like domain-containing protein [Hyphomicrobiaceae bacterium]
MRWVEVDEFHIDVVSVEETWARLKRDARSVLIDVRTIAEWAYVGLPDLSSINKRPVLVEWQGFPDDRLNAAFVDRVVEALEAIEADRNSELFFICRSGSRSLKAARAMAAAGYTRCRNVADGFEGPLDPDRHRGRLAGWKARGLPWAQG